MTTRKGSRLESLIGRDKNLRSRYQIVKEKAVEIIKWPSPADPSVPEVPPYSVLGKVREAQREYEVAFELDPGGEELNAQSFNNIAYSMITVGRFDEATRVLEIGIEKHPGFSYLYATKGLLYFRQGDVDLGRALYEQAISMSPDDLTLRRKFHYEHGMALRIQGRFDEAIEELECALNTASEYVLDEQIEVEIWKAERRDSSE